MLRWRAKKGEPRRHRLRSWNPVSRPRHFASPLGPSSSESSAMRHQGACRPSIRDCAFVPQGSDGEVESPKAHHGHRSMDVDGREPFLRFPRCLRKMTWLESPRFPKGRGSCSTERDWIPFIANCRHLLASRPTHQPLKWKKLKKISTLV